MTKDVWDSLKKLHGGDEKLKKVKLQSLRKEYKNMQMNDSEEITEFFSKLVVLTNQIKSCKEKISKLHKVEKVLITFLAKFDHIVVAIDESKDL